MNPGETTSDTANLPIDPDFITLDSAAYDKMDSAGGSDGDDGHGYLHRPHRLRLALPATLSKIVTAISLIAVEAVILVAVHPLLLLSTTTTTGGDTGSHVIMAAFMASHLLPHFHLTGWYPWWFDGTPLYSFYFIFPDLLAAAGGYIIPSAIAFKLATISGSIALPICAYAFGRLAGMERPYPAALGVFTLPFLFDQTFTILGGNLYSTFAGEYSYSFGIALALLVLGLTFRGIKTGRYRAVTALVLVVCVLSHLVAALFVTVGMIAVFVLSGPTMRKAWWIASTGIAAAMLAAFWEIPFVAYQKYTTSMGYVNSTHYMYLLYPVADRWAIWLAIAGLIFALIKRSRPIILLSLLGTAFAIGVVIDPQGKLWNERLVPIWILCVYLVAGYAICTAGLMIGSLWKRWRMVSYGTPRHLSGRYARRLARYRAAGHMPGSIGAQLLVTAISLAVVLPPLLIGSGSPGINLMNVVHIEPSNVSYWASWNYSGYQSKPAWPEFRGLMETMSKIGKHYGCGQAEWEYSHSLNRFGTTESLYTLPYWTNDCIGSLGGLLFESSATTPYFFINQSELSTAPSDAMVGLPYGPFNMELGVQQLQLMGVRYFMASSPTVERAASADRQLSLIATSGPWRSPYLGRIIDTTWKIYLVHNSAPVKALTSQPRVLAGVNGGQSSWMPVSVHWFNNPSDWKTYLLESGPKQLKRVRAANILSIGTATGPNAADAVSSGAANETATTAALSPGAALPPDRISDIHMGTDTIRFHVSTPDVPVVIDASYYPAWHVVGATGPYRTTPDFMVVIPYAHNIVLHYGSSPAGNTGLAVSGIGVIAWLGLAYKRRLLILPKRP